MLRMDSLCSIRSILFSHSAFVSSFGQVKTLYSPAITTASSSCVLLRLLSTSLLLSMSSILYLLLYLLFIYSYASIFFSYLLFPRNLSSSATHRSCGLVSAAMCPFATQKYALYSKFKTFKTRAPTSPNHSFLTRLESIANHSLYLHRPVGPRGLFLLCSFRLLSKQGPQLRDSAERCSFKLSEG